jgi:Transposase zinc-binding domain
MNRPTVEVADILRVQGQRFLDRYRASFDFQQLKAFRALQNCRTAALGGHLDACPQCGFKAISYNSCLMGSVFFWGVGVPEPTPGWALSAVLAEGNSP